MYICTSLMFFLPFVSFADSFPFHPIITTAYRTSSPNQQHTKCIFYRSCVHCFFWRMITFPIHKTIINPTHKATSDSEITLYLDYLVFGGIFYRFIYSREE